MAEAAGAAAHCPPFMRVHSYTPHMPPLASLGLRAFLGSHALAALSRAGPRAGSKPRGVHLPPRSINTPAPRV